MTQPGASPTEPRTEILSEVRTKAGLELVEWQPSLRATVLAIESEAAQAQGATPRAEGLNAANEWEAGYQACYERMQDEGRLLPAAGRAAPSAPQALDVERLRKALIYKGFAYQNWHNGDIDLPLSDVEEVAAEYSRLAPSEPTETGR